MSTLLSVIICNYNQGSYLEKRLESILQQLPEDSELILVDDGSTDNSVDIAEKVKLNDRRLLVFQNQVNQGFEKVFYEGFHRANGRYIMQVAVDDIMLPGCIERLLQPLLEHPELSFSSTMHVFWDEAEPDKGIQIHRYPLCDNPSVPYYILNANEVVEAVKMHDFYLAGSASIIKKSIFLRYGGIRKSLGVDWFFNHAVPLCEGMAFVAQPLHIWRKTATSFENLHTGREESKKMLFSILRFISQPKRSYLRKQFLRSYRLQVKCREFKKELLRFPRYYDFLLQAFKRRPRKTYIPYIDQIDLNIEDYCLQSGFPSEDLKCKVPSSV